VFKMERKTRKYTKEFKQEAVNLALKSPSISKTATELGIPVATLHSWVRQLKNKAESKSLKGEPNNSQNIAALIEENRRLHKELAITREEREILKKAAAYFAQHQK
jgi:transposase